jgi:hypothetical protein
MVISNVETYVILSCAKCSIGFGISSAFDKARRSDRQSFYCPAGHSQWFPGKPDDQVIRELKAQVASKERVSAGVCPCCTRTFQNLAQHMANQHPDFGGAGKGGE